MPPPDPDTPKGAMSVEAFCEWASIGRTVAYRENRGGAVARTETRAPHAYAAL